VDLLGQGIERPRLGKAVLQWVDSDDVASDDTMRAGGGSTVVVAVQPWRRSWFIPRPLKSTGSIRWRLTALRGSLS
jgi:hypothetical protein